MPSGIGLGERGFGGFVTRFFVGQSLADDASNSPLGTLNIIDAERGPIAVAEIELGGVAVQMPFLAMLIDADHAALKHAEKSLDGIGMRVATNVFLDAMVNAFMAGELLADVAVGAQLVGHQVALGVGVRKHDLAKLGGSNVFGGIDRARPPRSTRVTIGILPLYPRDLPRQPTPLVK